MTSFISAHDSGENLQALCDSCIQQLSQQKQDTHYTLAFLYASDHLSADLADIIHYLQDHLDVPHWVGTLGMGIIADNIEYHDTPALSIMLTDISESHFHILPPVTSSLQLYSLNIEDWLKQHSAHYALLHGDPNNPGIQTLVTQLKDKIPNVHVNGGITSSRGMQHQIADDICGAGLSGIIFSPPIDMISNLSQGCTPIAKPHKVTESDRNIAITLENKPALEVLKQDIGEILARDINNINIYIFAGIPLPEDPNQYMIRNIMGVDEREQQFAINEKIHKDASILFCRRDGNTALADMKRMLHELKDSLQGTTPKGGIYISCLGRGKYQFGDQSEEVKLIHSILGDFPLTGFFANSEIYQSRVYSFTGVLTLFK